MSYNMHCILYAKNVGLTKFFGAVSEFKGVYPEKFLKKFKKKLHRLLVCTNILLVNKKFAKKIDIKQI